MPKRAASGRVSAWWRCRLRSLPLQVGLAVLLMLALLGGLVWQASHFRQTINTAIYVTSLGVGLGVDPVTQGFEGASDSFKAGTSVMLVVTIVGWNGSAEARLLLGTTLAATQHWQVTDAFSATPAPQTHSTASVQLAETGRYRWEIDLISFASGSVPFVDGYITFQVT